jgi:hypothetical protein
MTSLFLLKAKPHRRRHISHGGLGGLVEVGQVALDAEDDELDKATWPRRRKPRPPTLDVSESRHLNPFRIPPNLDQECKTPWTPSNLDSLRFMVDRKHEGPVSSPTSQYAIASPVFADPSLPPSPTTPAQHFSSLPAELYGSLLQPSQGFPQKNPPIAPPRYPTPQRQLTDKSSDVGSASRLSTSSDSNYDDMDMLRPFSSPKNKAARLAKAVESSLSSSSSDCTLFNKPISSMNVDELLHRLPELNLNIVNHVWLPAMRNEFTKIKVLLQDAAELRLESHDQLRNFGEVCSLALIFDLMSLIILGPYDRLP